jgi:hypothetical protein
MKFITIYSKIEPELKQYYDEYKKYYDHFDEIYKNNIGKYSTQERRDAICSRDELLEKLSIMESNLSDYDSHLNYIICSYFVMIPATRSMDLVEMYIFKEGDDTNDKNKNWFLPNENTFIYNKYKTAKSFGQKIITINEIPDKYKSDFLKLCDIFCQFISYKNDYHNSNVSKKKVKSTQTIADPNRLLISANGTTLNQSSILRIISKNLSKPGTSMNVQLLRNIFVTEETKDLHKNISQIANIMGHTVDMQKKYIKE